MRLNGAALGIGLLVGLAVVLFRYLINFVENLAFHQYTGVRDLFTNTHAQETNVFGLSPLGWLVVFVPAAGGAAIAFIRWRWPETKVHGVSEVMGAVTAQGGVLRARTSLGHAAISAITVGTGGSVGREGPISYIGAAVGSSIARRLRFNPRDMKVLLGAGFAAGIGGTFSAPLGGTILALELVVPEFSTHAFIPIVLAAVLGTATAHQFFGSHATFQIASFSFGPPAGMGALASVGHYASELGAYVVVGALCGLGGVAFIRLLQDMNKFWRDLRIPVGFKPVLGGLCVGVMGYLMLVATNLATGGQGQYHLFGSGYSTVSNILAGGATLALVPLVLLALAKPLATSVTIGSGGGGGIFTASLLMGAAWGGLVGLAANAVFGGSATSFALVGMGAFYAATARATLTAIVVLAELTGTFTITLPLMLAAVVADAVSVALAPDSAYTVRLAEKGILYEHDRLQSPLDVARVRDVMTPRVATLPATMTVGEAFNRMLDAGHTGYPFVDAEGRLLGVVTRRDLSRQLQEGKGPAPLQEIVTRTPVTATPEEVLHRARDRMFGEQVGRLVVVDAKDARRIVGILTRSDILKAEAERDAGGPDAFEPGHDSEVTA